MIKCNVSNEFCDFYERKTESSCYLVRKKFMVKDWINECGIRKRFNRLEKAFKCGVMFSQWFKEKHK